MLSLQTYKTDILSKYCRGSFTLLKINNTCFKDLLYHRNFVFKWKNTSLKNDQVSVLRRAVFWATSLCQVWAPEPKRGTQWWAKTHRWGTQDYSCRKLLQDEYFSLRPRRCGSDGSDFQPGKREGRSWGLPLCTRCYGVMHCAGPSGSLKDFHSENPSTSSLQRQHGSGEGAWWSWVGGWCYWWGGTCHVGTTARSRASQGGTPVFIHTWPLGTMFWHRRFWDSGCLQVVLILTAQPGLELNVQPLLMVHNPYCILILMAR